MSATAPYTQMGSEIQWQFSSLGPDESKNVTLVVNQPEPIIRMPDLLGTSLSTAKASLQRLTYQDEIYPMQLGAVSYVPDSSVPANTVLMQFPPPDENVLIEERVYLLVSTRSEEEEGKTTSMKDLQGQNITIVSRFFRQNNMDYRIRHVKKPDQPWKSGQVYLIERKGNGPYLLDIYYKKPSARFQSGYELVDLSLAGEGSCQVELVPEEGSAKERGAVSLDPGDEVVFSTREHEEEEEVRVLFYRVGTVTLHGVCGTEEFYNKHLEPGDFS